MRTGHRPRLAVALACAGALLLAVLAYGFAVEPRRLTVTVVPIRGGALGAALDGRRAVLLGDLHFGGGPLGPARVLAAVDRARPDLILLVGDYVRWKAGAPAYDEALDFLARLRAPLGVFAVLGDADLASPRESCRLCHEPRSGAPTRRHGVTFLRDASARVRGPGGEVVVGGVNAPGVGPPSAALLSGRFGAGATPLVLLAHSSTAFAGVGGGGETLVLSGDTHGGQVRLPRWAWRLAMRKPDPAHLQGLFREGPRTLFVTRGVGTSRPHLRLGEPPEIVVFEFHAAGAGR